MPGGRSPDLEGRTPRGERVLGNVPRREAGDVLDVTPHGCRESLLNRDGNCCVPCPVRQAYGDMALELPRPAISSPASRSASSLIKNRAFALGGLAYSLAAEWDRMEEQRRISLVRSIHGLAQELNHFVEPGVSGSEASDSEVGAHWFGGLSSLTPREHQVLQALALGASTRKVADLFGITTATVRSHVKNILAKLGVHSRVQAVWLLHASKAHRKQLG
jgi:DNA-binding CsgD family transcriptional regulator